jgi:hypothetical protein
MLAIPTEAEYDCCSGCPYALNTSPQHMKITKITKTEIYDSLLLDRDIYWSTVFQHWQASGQVTHVEMYI